MRHFLFIFILSFFPILVFGQSNANDSYFKKLYLRTFKTEQHVLRFKSEGVELDGSIQYTGTKILIVQGPTTTLSAIQASTNVTENFTVNLDAGTVTLRKAHITLYDKNDYSVGEHAPRSDISRENNTPVATVGNTSSPVHQEGNLVVTFDQPIDVIQDNSTVPTQTALTAALVGTVAKDKRRETEKYSKALTNCQKNLRVMDKLISTYDTCGHVALLSQYDSIALLNQTLMDNVDKSFVTYNQRLRKAENDYMARLTNMQIKHDSIVNYIPNMLDADGFTFIINSEDKEAVLYRPITTSLSNYQIPSSITYRIHKLKVSEIGSNAFENNTQLTNMILPSSVLEIGNRAFAGCTQLKTIQLSDNLLIIGEEAFQHCSSLKSVTLPATVTKIKQKAFSGCTALTEVDAQMRNAIPLEAEVFDTTKDNDAILILPNGSFEPYISSSWCSFFNHLKEQLSKSTPSAHLLTEGGIFILKQNGTADFSRSQSGQYPEEFTIPNSTLNGSYTITGIGSNAFYNQENLKQVILPATIETIGDSAFAFCRSLTQINLPASLRTIGKKAFFDCKSLRHIHIPAEVHNIKEAAFAYCISLDSISLPHALKLVSEDLFLNCYQLQYVDIPSSVDIIGNNAFQNCSQLQSLTLREGTTTIGTNAFAGCQGLIVVDLPHSINLLGGNCFGGCGNIHALYCHREVPPTSASNTFSPDIIDAILYVPDKSEELYESMDFESKGFEKIKTLPDDDKLEKHKANALEDGLKEKEKKPKLREKRAEKEAKQRRKEIKKSL